jgi:hypothetical protein
LDLNPAIIRNGLVYNHISANPLPLEESQSGGRFPNLRLLI